MICGWFSSPGPADLNGEFARCNKNITESGIKTE